MKKLALALPLFLLLTLLSHKAIADEPSIVVDEKPVVSVIDTLKTLPGLKQGMAFDVEEGQFNYLTTIGIIKYNDFGLSAGYSSDNKAVATLTYRLGGLNRFGIDTPITNLVDIEVGMYAGYGRLTGSNEFSWGPSVTILNVKF